jgi:hypothetical protein
MATQLFVFHGDYQRACKWLTIADQHITMNDKDHEKIQVISGKLDRDALIWFNGLSKGLKKHWDILRELFVAKWIDKLADDKMKKKQVQLIHQLNPLQGGSLALDALFATPVCESAPTAPTIFMAPLAPLTCDKVFAVAFNIPGCW